LALTIDNVAIAMDVAASGAEPGRPSAQPLTDAELRNRLRPIVLEILAAEIDRLRREQG
jgi:hypothetical protein